MQLIIIFIIFFCLYACKENAQEKEVEFELNKSEANSFEPYKSFHLGGGLCVAKDIEAGPNMQWVVRFGSCYDSLPADTATPIENIVKYKQGGLCFLHDCSIEPEKSFTMLMNIPKGFINSNTYWTFNIFISKYNDSTMLYKHAKKHAFSYSLLSIKDQKEYMKKLDSIKKDKDTIIFFKEYSKFWEELFSMGKPLKVQYEDFSGNCNSKFCSTKDILEPLYEIHCYYGLKSKGVECYPEAMGLPRRRIKPKCLDKLERLSKEYDILMHGGAFPAGDCDLSNWRYLKIDSLNKEHYEKLKGLVKPPENY